ncbi:MAG: Calx-beta protein [Planctomycetota bacterium]|nr:Calx-beta protein [Planctomycetota bacterium]
MKSMIRAVRPRSRRRFFLLEALERRDCPSVTIQFDYSLDSNNFFNTQAKRDLLQIAANTLTSELTDSLTPIVPAGGNSWTANFTNPASGAKVSLDNPMIPADTIVVFVGSRALGGSELGLAETGGESSFGTDLWNDTVLARGQVGALSILQTDFGPWGGSIAFDSKVNWYFGIDAAGLGSKQDDFLSVAEHEIGHILGFGTAESWRQKIVLGKFTGLSSTINYDLGGSPPVSPDGGHLAQGITDGGFQPVMTPTILQGTRKLMTHLDFAGLQDLGWQLLAEPHAQLTTALVTDIHGIAGLPAGGVDTGFFISNPTQVDLYKFKVDAGVTITFDAGPASTFLRIFNEAAAELAHSSAGSTRLSFKFDTAGSYYLGISAAGNTRYSVIDPYQQILAGPTGGYTLTYDADGGKGGVVGGSSAADLASGLSAPATATVGVPFSFTLSVANNGPNSADPVTLTQLLPASASLVSVHPSQGTASLVGSTLLISLGSLAPGATAAVQVTVLPGAVGSLGLSVSAHALQTDPVASNNVTTATTLVSIASSSPPEFVDTTPPFIANVSLTSSGKKAKKTFTLTLSFSEALDPATASLPGNFSLSKPGKARRRKPGPRVALGLSSISYDPTRNVVTMTLGVTKTLPKGLQLVAVGASPSGLRDLSNNFLDGSRTGRAGTNATLKIS